MRIVYSPRGADQITDLVTDISKGGIIAESVAEADPAASSKPPAAVGPEPNQSQVALRTEAARSILGGPRAESPSLWESGSDGTAQRESFRRAFHDLSIFHGLCVMLSRRINVEKLETPVTLSLR